MSDRPAVRHPRLVAHAKYRWDRVREQHQLVFPEGMIELNEPGAAIIKLCDGRSFDAVVDALKEAFPGADPADDVAEFLELLAKRGLVLDGTPDP